MKGRMGLYKRTNMMLIFISLIFGIFWDTFWTFWDSFFLYFLGFFTR